MHCKHDNIAPRYRLIGAHGCSAVQKINSASSAVAEPEKTASWYLLYLEHHVEKQSGAVPTLTCIMVSVMRERTAYQVDRIDV